MPLQRTMSEVARDDAADPADVDATPALCAAR